MTRCPTVRAFPFPRRPLFMGDGIMNPSRGPGKHVPCGAPGDIDVDCRWNWSLTSGAGDATPTGIRTPNSPAIRTGPRGYVVFVLGAVELGRVTSQAGEFPRDLVQKPKSLLGEPHCPFGAL